MRIKRSCKIMKELIMFVSASSVTCSSEQEVFLLTKGNVRQLLLQSSIIVDSRTANLPPIISFRFAVTERATKAHSNVDPVQSSSKQRRNSRTTRTEATQRSPVISVNTAARSSRPPTPWRDMSGMCTSCLSGAPVSAGPGGRATREEEEGQDQDSLPRGEVRVQDLRQAGPGEAHRPQTPQGGSHQEGVQV